jgi:hypothetical protein
MLPDFLSIQPDSCPELCLVNMQNRDTVFSSELEPAMVPKPIAVLVGDTRIPNKLARRRLACSDAIQNQLAAGEGVHLWKSRCRRVSESRDGNFVEELCGNYIGNLGIGYVPLAIKRNDLALGEARRYGAKENNDRNESHGFSADNEVDGTASTATGAIRSIFAQTR